MENESVDLVECPKCLEKVKKLVRICPHCTSKLPYTRKIAAAPRQAKPSPTTDQMKIGLGLSVVIICGFIGSLFLWASQQPKPMDDFRYVVGRSDDGNRHSVVQLKDGSNGGWSPKRGTKLRIISIRDGVATAEPLDGRAVGTVKELYINLDKLSDKAPITDTPSPQEDKLDKEIEVYPNGRGILVLPDKQ